MKKQQRLSAVVLAMLLGVAAIGCDREKTPENETFQTTSDNKTLENTEAINTEQKEEMTTGQAHPDWNYVTVLTGYDKKFTDGTIKKATIHYGEDGKLQNIDQNGEVTPFVYEDGILISGINIRGRVQSFYTDSLGNLYDGYETTRYEVDEQGRIKDVVYGSKHERYEYDDQNRFTREVVYFDDILDELVEYTYHGDTTTKTRTRYDEETGAVKELRIWEITLTGETRTERDLEYKISDGSQKILIETTTTYDLQGRLLKEEVVFEGSTYLTKEGIFEENGSVYHYISYPHFFKYTGGGRNNSPKEYVVKYSNAGMPIEYYHLMEDGAINEEEEHGFAEYDEKGNLVKIRVEKGEAYAEYYFQQMPDNYVEKNTKYMELFIPNHTNFWYIL